MNLPCDRFAKRDIAPSSLFWTSAWPVYTVITPQRQARVVMAGFLREFNAFVYSVFTIPLALRLGTAPTGIFFTTVMVLRSTTTVTSSPAAAT